MTGGMFGPPPGRHVRHETDLAAIDHDMRWHGDVYVEMGDAPVARTFEYRKGGVAFWRAQATPPDPDDLKVTR